MSGSPGAQNANTLQLSCRWNPRWLSDGDRMAHENSKLQFEDAPHSSALEPQSQLSCTSPDSPPARAGLFQASNAISPCLDRSNRSASSSVKLGLRRGDRAEERRSGLYLPNLRTRYAAPIPVGNNQARIRQKSLCAKAPVPLRLKQ